MKGNVGWRDIAFFTSNKPILQYTLVSICHGAFFHSCPSSMIDVVSFTEKNEYMLFYDNK